MPPLYDAMADIHTCETFVWPPKNIGTKNKEWPLGEVKWAWHRKSRDMWACLAVTWTRGWGSVQSATKRTGLETRLGGAGLVNAGLARDHFSAFLPSYIT